MVDVEELVQRELGSLTRRGAHEYVTRCRVLPAALTNSQFAQHFICLRETLQQLHVVKIMRATIAHPHPPRPLPSSPNDSQTASPFSSGRWPPRVQHLSRPTSTTSYHPLQVLVLDPFLRGLAGPPETRRRSRREMGVVFLCRERR